MLVFLLSLVWGQRIVMLLQTHEANRKPSLLGPGDKSWHFYWVAVFELR